MDFVASDFLISRVLQKYLISLILVIKDVEVNSFAIPTHNFYVDI